MKTRLAALLVVFASGCASMGTMAPSDLVEEPGATTPYGRIVTVVKKTYSAGPDPGGMAGAAAFGALGVLIGGMIGEAAGRDTRYIYEIRTSSGEMLTEMSVYEFPVGACVSVGANKTSYKGILANSSRCLAN